MRGLTGLQPVQELRIRGCALRLVRPLLRIERRDTETYCATFKLNPRQDSSNQSRRMLRNRVRHELLPLLQSYNSGISKSLLRLAEIAADDLEYLEGQTAKAWRRIVSWEGQTLVLDKAKFRRLDVALQRQVLRAAIHELSGTLKDIETRHIDSIIKALDKATGSRLDLPYGLIFSLDYGCYRLGLDQKEAGILSDLEGEYELKIPGLSRIPGWEIEAHLGPASRLGVEDGSDPLQARLDATLTGSKITLRARRRGDSFQPLGMSHSKKLAEFMLDAKVPRTWRNRVPILSSPGGIIWVAGYRIDERFKITANSSRVLTLRMKRV
jgi:tRNA(Ile)-lysidine synthase